MNVGFFDLLDRLGISFPELTEMQARAIFEAALSVSKEGVKVHPEIMVPLVGTPQACHSCNLFPFDYLVLYIEGRTLMRMITCLNCRNLDIKQL